MNDFPLAFVVFLRCIHGIFLVTFHGTINSDRNTSLKKVIGSKTFYKILERLSRTPSTMKEFYKNRAYYSCLKRAFGLKKCFLEILQ